MRSGIKRGWLLALLVALSGASCASLHAYHGPAGVAPVIEVEELRSVDSVTDPNAPVWRSTFIAHVSNPTGSGEQVGVECHRLIEVYSIPARMTQDVLVEPNHKGNANCRIFSWMPASWVSP